jgi:TetR/AcrR family transcriptional regulator of autoinduction and epiphytic fitness
MSAPDAMDAISLHALNRETDGRRRRTLRTNAALIDATILLFRAGATSPTANAVAREASVSARSLFAHFADVPLLYQAAIRRVLDDLLSSEAPDTHKGALGDRIDGLVSHHAQACESWLPFQRAASALRYEYPELWQRCLSAREQLNERLRAVFAPELTQHDEDEAEALVDTLATFIDWDAWSRLRADRGLSVERARAVWALGLSRLIAASSVRTQPADAERALAFN